MGRIDEVRGRTRLRGEGNRDRMRRLTGAFVRKMKRVVVRGEEEVREVERGLEVEIESTRVTLQNQNRAFKGKVEEEVDGRRARGVEEVAVARGNLRARMRDVTNVGVAKVQGIRDGTVRGVLEVEAEVEGEIAVVKRETEKVLEEIRKEEEEALEEIRSRELRRYREYQLDMTKKLIQLKEEVEELEEVVKMREGMIVRYEEEKKSLRKILGLILTVGRKRTRRVRRKLVKRLLR